MTARTTQAIRHLTAGFTEMGMAVSEQIYQATTAFARHDPDRARQVIEADRAINETELRLARRSLRVLALQQPQASAFRAVMTVVKASVDLEQIGDNAVAIARETLLLPTATGLPSVAELLGQMTLAIQTMLEQGLDAYLRQEPDLARQVAESDLTIDRDFVRLRHHLIRELGADPKLAATITSYLVVARLLEHIGDHVVNVTEWVVYGATGQLVELNPGKLDRRRVTE